MDFATLEETPRRGITCTCTGGNADASGTARHENLLESTAISAVITEYSTNQILLVPPSTKREDKADQIVLTGKALFFRGQLVERDCCIVFQVSEGQAAFTMVTSGLGSGYNLAADFKPFVGTSIAELPFDAASLILSSAPSSAITSPVCGQSGLMFSVGLSFNGAPNGKGSLTPYGWLFEDLPSVIVHGKMDLDAAGNPLGTLEGTPRASRWVLSLSSPAWRS